MYVFNESIWFLSKITLAVLFISTKFLIDSGFKNIFYRKVFINQKNSFYEIMKMSLN